MRFAPEDVTVCVTSYRRPEMLRECLAQLASYPAPVHEVIVRDNSPERSLDDSSVTYLWDGCNPGLPFAVGLMVEHATTPVILILDDDTILPFVIFNQMLEALDGPDAVTVPTPTTPLGMFPWSPTLIRKDAFDRFGAPLSDLFFTFDDWEYSHRIVRGGGRIVHLSATLPRQMAGTTWPGRMYFGARNSTYLLSRRRVLNAPMLRAWLQLVRAAFASPDPSIRKACRAGILDGALGNLGSAIEYLPGASRQ